MNPSDLSQQQLEQIVNRVVERVMQQTQSAPQTGMQISQEEKCVRDAIDGGACRISPDQLPSNCSAVAEYIDHTLLKPDARVEEVEELCREAIEYKFASVCINPTHIELAAKLLAGSSVKVCTVIGFPLGSMTKESKAFETRDAVAKGADEIDMVINISQLKSQNYQVVLEDIQMVRKACQNKILKVILETALLSDEEIKTGSMLSKAAGADFVKTSTGFSKGGASKEAVSLMRETVGTTMGVKASGGVRDCNIAQEMIQSGATRIGASASVAIIKGETGKSTY